MVQRMKTCEELALGSHHTKMISIPSQKKIPIIESPKNGQSRALLARGYDVVEVRITEIRRKQDATTKCAAKMDYK